MIRLLSWVFIFLITYLAISPPSLAQTPIGDTNAEPEPYHESAPRRFEIIFAISLPFTSLHSYLAVRGVEMARQRKVAPELTGTHWKSIGGLALLFSSCIAFWDYLHTRGEDIQDIGVPQEPLEPLTAIFDNRYQALAGGPTLKLLAMKF